MLEKKKRDLWVDALKGFAILCVVMGHTLERTFTGTGNINPVLNQINIFIYGFHMPLFFMVSGFVYAITDRKKNEIKNNQLTAFIHKKFLDLMVPYMFFALLVWVGKYIFSKFVTYTVTFTDLLKLFINPIAFLWFIYILFFVSILIYTLELNIKNTNIIFLITILLIISRLFITTDIKLIDRVLFYPFFYYLGVVFYEWKNKMVTKNLFVVCSILFAGLSILHANNESNGLITILVNAIGSITFTQLFYLLFKNKKKNILTFLGTITMYIYILHPIVLNAVKVVLVIIHTKMIGVWLIVLFVSGVSFPIMYYLIAQKVWILDILFRPRKYVKRNKKNMKGLNEDVCNLS